MPASAKVALVTGAARGIGQAIAVRLAKDGLTVAVADRRPLVETLEIIKASGGAAAGFDIDVSDPESVAAGAKSVNEKFGDVSVLVNNAALHANPIVNVKDMDFADWRRLMAVNLDGVFLMTKPVLPKMIDAQWGRIINIASASVNAFTPPGMAHYIASKAGVVGFTRGLATDLGEYGITVNAIAPTGVMTPGIIEVAEGADMSDLVVQSQAIKRVAQPDDIAGAVSFLASDDSQMMTAQTLFVDGGAIRAG